ncbi:hypothetical protein T01_15797 [Trichinella spiralis]|uniref:Uncharacterized protein n=1 Tax=Trichinella spiralis TaxID=6334 RepID=A0A0V1BCT1_TRISP|nr:hypothetical protein T01_15797 [Trichinella spiralis]
MPVASIMQKAAGPMEDVHRTDKAPKAPTQSIEGFEHQKSVASISRDCTYVAWLHAWLHASWLQFYQNDTIMQRKQKKEAVQIAQCGSKMMEWKNDSNFKTKSISSQKVIKANDASLLNLEVSPYRTRCSEDKRRDLSEEAMFYANPRWDYRLELASVALGEP